MRCIIWWNHSHKTIERVGVILSVLILHFLGLIFFVIFNFILQLEPKKCYVSGYDSANYLRMHYRTCKSFLAAYYFSMFFRYVLCFDVYGRLNDLYVNFQFFFSFMLNSNEMCRTLNEYKNHFFRGVRFYFVSRGCIRRNSVCIYVIKLV